MPYSKSSSYNDLKKPQFINDLHTEIQGSWRPQKCTQIPVIALIFIILLLYLGIVINRNVNLETNKNLKAKEHWEHCLYDYVGQVCNFRTTKDNKNDQKKCQENFQCLVSGFQASQMSMILMALEISLKQITIIVVLLTFLTILTQFCTQ